MTPGPVPRAAALRGGRDAPPHRRQVAPLGARDEVCYWSCPTPPDWLLLDQAKDTWWQWDIQPSAMAAYYPRAKYRIVFHQGEVWLLKRAA